MRIAVIIPTQFKRDTIIESLQSVYAQTRKPDEIIIVNGDNQAKQMNQAIEMSTCEAFVYLSDDDLLEPNFIEIHEKMMGEFQIIYSNFREFGERNEIQTTPFPCSTNLMLKRAWEYVGKFDENVGMAFDWEFALRLKEIRIKHIEEPLWKYRTHPGQRSLDTEAMNESGRLIKAKQNQ